jgi:serine/threonine protein kinase
MLKIYSYLVKYFLCWQPCIINTQEVVDTQSVLFIILEFMEGGDLLRRMHPYNSLKEADMKLIFFQLAQAIEYLHQKSIVHRDIKVIIHITKKQQWN